MSEELDLLLLVAERLNRAGVAYMLSGSTAMNVYAVPRMTRDIDLVVEVGHTAIDRIAATRPTSTATATGSDRLSSTRAASTRSTPQPSSRSIASCARIRRTVAPSSRAGGRSPSRDDLLAEVRT